MHIIWFDAHAVMIMCEVRRASSHDYSLPPVLYPQNSSFHMNFSNG